MKCPYCNNEIPTGINACPICGKLIIGGKQENTKINKRLSDVSKKEVTSYKRKSVPFSFEGILGFLWIAAFVFFMIGILIKAIFGF